MKLDQALRQWGTPGFEQVLKTELENLPAGSLPLHKATTQGGVIADCTVTFSVLGSRADAAEISIRAGVFFTELVAGCNCSDPPFEANVYCLLEIAINRKNAEATVRIVSD